MRLNLNSLKKRVAALEQAAVIRRGGNDDAERLSPRDVCFLISEQADLDRENTQEAAILSARIGDLLRNHARACRIFRGVQMTTSEKHKDISAGLAMTDEQHEQYRQGWYNKLITESREMVQE